MMSSAFSDVSRVSNVSTCTLGFRSWRRARRLELGRPHRGRAVEDLTLQVGLVDDVEVHEPERAHARRGEVQRRRRAEPARAYEQDAGGLELFLPLDAY